MGTCASKKEVISWLSLIPQRINGIQAGGFHGRIQSGNEAGNKANEHACEYP
jgi:hypothetical protein